MTFNELIGAIILTILTCGILKIVIFGIYQVVLDFIKQW